MGTQGAPASSMIVLARHATRTVAGHTLRRTRKWSRRPPGDATGGGGEMCGVPTRRGMPRRDPPRAAFSAGVTSPVRLGVHSMFVCWGPRCEACQLPRNDLNRCPRPRQDLSVGRSVLGGPSETQTMRSNSRPQVPPSGFVHMGKWPVPSGGGDVCSPRRRALARVPGFFFLKDRRLAHSSVE